MVALPSHHSVTAPHHIAADDVGQPWHTIHPQDTPYAWHIHEIDRHHPCADDGPRPAVTPTAQSIPSLKTLKVFQLLATMRADQTHDTLFTVYPVSLMPERGVFQAVIPVSAPGHWWPTDPAWFFHFFSQLDPCIEWSNGFVFCPGPGVDLRGGKTWGGIPIP